LAILAVLILGGACLCYYAGVIIAYSASYAKKQIFLDDIDIVEDSIGMHSCDGTGKDRRV